MKQEWNHGAAAPGKDAAALSVFFLKPVFLFSLTNILYISVVSFVFLC